MIKVKKICNIKGKKYEIGDEFKPKKEDMPLVIRLNEKGFIEPLSRTELLELSNSFNFDKKGKGKGDK